MSHDEVDLKILEALQRDARKSYREVASEVGVSEGTVYNRIEKMEEKGILKGFIPNIDYSEIGYDIIGIFGITGEGSQLEDLEREIAKNSNVTSVYDVTGEYDAIAVGKFKDRDGLNRFVKDMLSKEDVKRTYTMLVLNTVKESHSVELYTN